MRGVVDMANAGFEEDREEPSPTPHQDKMRQAAFPSGQARYATEHGDEIQVVSLTFALLLAKQFEDLERELKIQDAANEILEHLLEEQRTRIAALESARPEALPKEPTMGMWDDFNAVHNIAFEDFQKAAQAMLDGMRR